MSELPILPPEIIDKIMVYYTHMLTFSRPTYLLEIEIFRAYPYFISTDKFYVFQYLFVNLGKFRKYMREFMPMISLLTYPYLNLRRPEIEKLWWEFSNIWRACWDPPLCHHMDELDEIFLGQEKLHNHRIRILENDGVFDPVCKEFPFYNDDKLPDQVIGLIWSR